MSTQRHSHDVFRNANRIILITASCVVAALTGKLSFQLSNLFIHRSHPDDRTTRKRGVRRPVSERSWNTYVFHQRGSHLPSYMLAIARYFMKRITVNCSNSREHTWWRQRDLLTLPLRYLFTQVSLDIVGMRESFCVSRYSFLSINLREKETYTSGYIL